MTGFRVKSKSDIITNSSSEVFCYIEGGGRKMLQEVVETLVPIFGFSQERELDALAYLGKRKSKEHIVIEIPFRSGRGEAVRAFYREGLKALIESRPEWKDNLRIDFSHAGQEL